VFANANRYVLMEIYDEKLDFVADFQLLQQCCCYNFTARRAGE
jgi:hypothetical protein